eukprot:gb/GEZN01017737.1/.p1 GENE.gb/GEZN01017737.1/~~gb/GEZN01017737.1/.p1  ORF type:complete len:103 (-),score=5.42 gb/GEZN01017737.1/:395-703(-)
MLRPEAAEAEAEDKEWICLPQSSHLPSGSNRFSSSQSVQYALCSALPRCPPRCPNCKSSNDINTQHQSSEDRTPQYLPGRRAHGLSSCPGGLPVEREREECG